MRPRDVARLFANKVDVAESHDAHEICVFLLKFLRSPVAHKMNFQPFNSSRSWYQRQAGNEYRYHSPGVVVSTVVCFRKNWTVCDKPRKNVTCARVIIFGERERERRSVKRARTWNSF